MDNLFWWTDILEKVRAANSRQSAYFASCAMKARAAGPGGASFR
jgi:hypothetical protein